jgi:phenol 2-monooxygenase
MPQQTPVLIIGSGSAGLSAATWLARYNIPYRVLERSSGPLKLGKADGVQCRTVEIFESFGMGEDLLREAYHVLEVGFWADDGSGSVKRTGRTADVQPGLSHCPHVILNQARINGLFIEKMEEFGGRDVEYGWDVRGVSVEKEGEFPVKVTARRVGENGEEEGVEEIFEAKYALVCMLLS